VVKGCKILQDSHKNVSTIWRKLLHKGRCINGWKGSKAAEQACWWRPLRPSDHEWWTVFKKLMLWFKRIHGLLLLMWPMSWISAVDLYIPSSTRASDTTCARWVPKQLTHEHKHACNFCSNGLSQAIKPGCTIINLQVSKHGVETNVITQEQEIQKCAFCKQSDIDSILGP